MKVFKAGGRKKYCPYDKTKLIHRYFKCSICPKCGWEDR